MVIALTNTLENLLDEAEAEIRLRGYHAVSFRELANTLGIKSASVHYYFRQKEDLGIALVKRYRERFFENLDSRAGNYENPVRAFIDVYREALNSTDRICLCGMLGSESSGLPQSLSDEVSAFFRANIDWVAKNLRGSLTASERKRKSEHTVSTLQGAMMLSANLKDYKIFDRAAKELLD